MKKRFFKRAVSIGMALALTLGLSACGGGNKKENAGLAKENVYKFEAFTMPDIGGDDYNIYTSNYKDGIIYLVLQVYHWSENNADMDIRMLTMKEDGTDVQLTPLEMPEWKGASGNAGAAGEPGEGGAAVGRPIARTEEGAAGDTTEPETEEGATEDTAEPETEEGAAEDTTEPETEDGDTAEPDTGEDIIDMPIDEGFNMPEQNFYENTYFGNYTFGADGMLYAIRNYYFEDYAAEEYTYIQKNYVDCWNLDGSLAWETELEGLSSEEEYLYVSAMTVTADGNLTLLLNGDKAYKLSVDGQGNMSGRKPLSDDVAKIFENGASVMTKRDGTFMVTYYDEQDWSKQYITTFDPNTDTLGQPSQLPTSMTWDGYNTMTTGISSDLIYSNSKGVFTYKMGDTESKMKMNFINSDMNVSDFSSLIELTDTSFIGIFRENYGEETQAGIFTYVDPKDIPDKAVLVLAGNWIGSDMKQRIVEYNRSNDEYRITVKEYDSYNTYEDYQAGLTQLNNDITTGNMPDILVTSGLPVENYISKGLLADVGKLIEKDEELSQVEFVQNVMDAYSVDGKLYYVFPSFRVSTMIGKTSIVGDRTSWTMADMMELMNTLPEGTNMLGEMTRDNFMYTMMDFCGADFIDVSTGKCEFDSQNFISMMEFAKELPEELSEDYFGEDYWMNYESQYRENRTILRNLYIGRLSDVNSTINGSFGEPVSFVGFPTESGMGSYVQATDCYAISAKSANIDGAWAFLRYYLTDEYQEELSWGMPIQMKYFMENAQEATQRPYYLDENGNKQEYDDYFYMGGEEIKLDPMSQEQVDQLVNFIFSINKCYYGNNDITTIINEEMPSFFSGQKSAQEVAKIIQSRAQLFVDENR
ncbi:MAG: extracellular solute-binding protein [Lachnospiraceae bacterium]|nr:extracellular solute-binding protein [Lachnospiraceae bacterium]